MGCVESSSANIPLREADEAAEKHTEKEKDQIIVETDTRPEAISKFKRQNVFTEGINVDEKIPNIKRISKTDTQKSIICKYLF